MSKRRPAGERAVYAMKYVRFSFVPSAFSLRFPRPTNRGGDRARLREIKLWRYRRYR